MRVLKAFLVAVLVVVALSQVFRRDAPPPEPAPPAAGPPASPVPTSGGLPNYREDIPERTDLRGGAAGIPLRLRYVVRDAAGEPVAGAKVEVWHTDARGGYSHAPADFCRGWSTTDGQGTVEFETIRPASYGLPGNFPHIHSRISKAGVGDRGDQLDLPKEAGASVRGEQGMSARLEEEDLFVVETTLPRVGPRPMPPR